MRGGKQECRRLLGSEANEYKFAFIVINLLVMILTGVLALYIGFAKCHIYILYTIFVLLNTIFTLIDALTNVIFCLAYKSKK